MIKHTRPAELFQNNLKSFMFQNNISHQHIVIVDYDERWNESFQVESDKLKTLLSDLLIQTHHIGSTSVTGLAAKPVIDLLLEVTDVSAIDKIQTTITESGYQFWGEYGLAGRRFLTKGTDPRTHNIHCYDTGNTEVDRHLAFRDYLRTHPGVASEYEDLKKKLAANCNHNIEKYCQGKDAFIKHHQEHALKYIASLQEESTGE